MVDTLATTSKHRARHRNRSRYKTRAHVNVRPAGPVPAVSYPDSLPISHYADEIASLLDNHQVVVVAGETGSGKSTQLPKMCLQRCLMHDGMIAHTQPRRIAAREVAARLARETGTRLGDLIGYKVRFGERTGPGTRIKVVTDGMLLAEMSGDRELRAYHTVIVDEAHERSINIDFILGFLKQLLHRRPELKVIVTSATIDTERFANHFDGAPIVEVSGRTYPVEVVYQPVEETESDEDNWLAGLERATRMLWQHGSGDILAFLPGEREIRDAQAFLGRELSDDVQILPLYARLSPAEQKRIFTPSRGRRIILSTNVAETSLTVPGVRYVIDTGLARVSRYSLARKVQRLPVERISQAAVNQRKGRCGRVQSGICVRLYNEDDFESRPLYTDPEIQRTSLASVILKLKALSIGDIKRFPFVDAPDPRQIRSGIRLLHEIGALDKMDRLTATGRELSKLPVDPRVGRLLVESELRQCTREMLIIASRLSIREPQFLPPDQLEKARMHHAAWPPGGSDIHAMLALFDCYSDAAKLLSRRALNRWCEDQFLSPTRMREWQELHDQLALLAKDNRWDIRAEVVTDEEVARAFLSGFLGNIAAMDDRGVWRGSHNKIVYIHPSSRSFKKKPKWIVAAELVDSSKLYARQVLPVKPEWIEAAAGDLLKFEYAEPSWDEKNGQVTAYRSARLFGVTLYCRRRVHFGSVDPVTARQIFIREALVGGRLKESYKFLECNRALIEEAESIRRRLRYLNNLVDEEALYEYFDDVVPTHVFSASTLRKWIDRETSCEDLLTIDRSIVIGEHLMDSAQQFPTNIDFKGTPLKIDYEFLPGDERDGVTVEVPLPLVGQFDPDTCIRQIPGWFEQRVEALLRSLPKVHRRALQPIKQSARLVVKSIDQQSKHNGSIQSSMELEAVCAVLVAQFTIKVRPADFDTSIIPDHLLLRVVLRNAAGDVVDSSRDYEQLKLRNRDASRDAFLTADVKGFPVTGLRAWNFDDIPAYVEVPGFDTLLRAYPALVDKADHVDLVLFDDPLTSRQSHLGGVRRLVKIIFKRPINDVTRQTNLDRVALKYAGLYPESRLRGAFEDALANSLLSLSVDLPYGRDDFNSRIESARNKLVHEGMRLADYVGKAVDMAYEVQRHLDGIEDADFTDLILSHLDSLVGPGFPACHPASWIEHLPRFVEALSIRVEKRRLNPDSDEVQRFRVDTFRSRLDTIDASHILDTQALEFYRFLVEEFSVSLFAQSLGTSQPVSAKRLEQLWSRVVG